jgi:hypothetical protein
MQAEIDEQATRQRILVGESEVDRTKERRKRRVGTKSAGYFQRQ